MSQTIGITNIKIVLLAIAEASGVVDKVTNHGTTWMEKLAGLMQLVPVLAGLPVVSLKALQDEVSDLDDIEKAELIAAFKARFDLADDKLEQAIVATLAILGKLDGIVKDVEGIAKIFHPAA